MTHTNQTKQALANLSGKRVGNISLASLEARLTPKVLAQRAKEGQYKYRDTTPQAFVRHLRDKAAARIGAASEATSSHLPVSSVYDALQIAKQYKHASTDAGIRAFKGMLDSMWKKDRMGKITAAQFVKYRDYYTSNFPKSAVAEVLTSIGQKGYASLPVSKLLKIARNICTQSDYDYEITQAGLHTNQPHHVKSREFIMSVVNGQTEVPNPFEEREDEYNAILESYNTGDEAADLIRLYEENKDLFDSIFIVKEFEDGEVLHSDSIKLERVVDELSQYTSDGYKGNGVWGFEGDSEEIGVASQDGRSISEDVAEVLNALLNNDGFIFEMADDLKGLYNPKTEKPDPNRLSLPAVARRTNKKRVSKMRRRAQEVDVNALDEFTLAAWSALAWSSHNEDYKPDDEDSFENFDDASWYNLDAESQQLFAKECADFQNTNADLLEEAYAFDNYEGASQAGYDFTLTRGEHGVGFWDRGLEEVGDELTAAAEKYRPQYLFWKDGAVPGDDAEGSLCIEQD